MRYVLGFDGGGTKTECVLMDETGAILARSRSGPSNPSRVALDAAFEAVVEASEKALAAAGKSASDIADICGAIGGVGIAGAISEFHKRLKLRFPNARSAFVVTDLSMALAAAGEPPCIVVIAGTGSAAYGRVDYEKTARDGGFGPVLGDPGSAYDIARKAVVAEWRRSLSGEESHFRNEILDAFKCNWVELNSMISSNPDSVLPRIFPLVTKAANEGDESARALLRSGAEDLIALIERVVDRLTLRDKPFFLAKTGGVFNRSKHFDDHFDELVVKIAPKAKVGLLPNIAEFCARAARDCADTPIIDVGPKL
jgi:N-acetylglucosamine kinase-like BadF-type ATPase